MVPWPVQMRWLMVLMMVPLFTFLTYLNAGQFYNTMSPLSDSNDNYIHGRYEESTNVTTGASTSDVEIPVPIFAIKDVYEPGHLGVNLDICPLLGNDVELLIVVTSDPRHGDARLAIRETWGHYTLRNNVAITFIVGSTSNKSLLDKIIQEQDTYRDLIRGKFIDSYDNLTLKTLSMLEWVDTYCPKASFLLKTDDDMFINVPLLLEFIHSHNPDDNTIYGRLAKKWKPVRYSSKYYISPEQYSPSVFPHFTTGPAYLLPAQLSKQMYSAALNQTYIKLEDVFFNGILASSLDIKREHVAKFYNKWISFTTCHLQEHISIHGVKSNLQYDLWKKFHDHENCKASYSILQ